MPVLPWVIDAIKRVKEALAPPKPPQSQIGLINNTVSGGTVTNNYIVLPESVDLPALIEALSAQATADVPPSNPTVLIPEQAQAQLPPGE